MYIVMWTPNENNQWYFLDAYHTYPVVAYEPPEQIKIINTLYANIETLIMYSALTGETIDQIRHNH
jgi:hypothetical protein